MPLITIDVKLPPESDALLLELAEAPQEIPRAIKRGLDYALQIVAGRIQQKRLSGTGPFPVSDHRLGERSGNLRRSVRATPAIIRGDTVVAEIGASAAKRGFPYGLSHEFGATVYGNPFLVFNIGTRKVFARKVVIPAREPFQTELNDNADFIADQVMNELEKSVAKL